MGLFHSLHRKKLSGFVYVAGDQQDPRFANARPGDVIRNASSEPPWIIVDHALEDVTVAHWPGDLWEAEVVEALRPQGHRGNYTRAVAVRLTHRLPACTLFGPHGEIVAKIIERARRLTRAEAEHLAGLRADMAGQLYSKAWTVWAERSGRATGQEDWESVLASGTTGASSPVNHGLKLVHSAVFDRAMELDGEQALMPEEDHFPDSGTHLDVPWGTASLCLIEAAMALGAPDLLAEEDRAVLTRPWQALTGPSQV